MAACQFIPLIVRRWDTAWLKYRSAITGGNTDRQKPADPTEVPDLLTVFFLIKYTAKPLHFFGRIGSLLFAAGFAVLSYLTVLWFRGIPIGTRPLLSFGVLLVLVGAQIVFTGLLADLIVNMNQDRKQEFPIKRL